ncbi:MAG: hypothetical protein P8I91_02880 [Phycisphaerales bacterium]|nr:hypothetical protein [Phycisphaerales bacterium]
MLYPMMNTILPVLMIVGAASQALGQEPTPAATEMSEPSAETIINRYLEVTGGRPAWEAIQSLRGLGTLEVLGAGLTGNVAIFQTRAGFYRSVDTGIGGAQVTVRNGDQAWSVGPNGVVAQMQGEELQKLLQDKDFNPLLNISALYESVSLAGVEEVDGSQAWKVQCLPIGGIGGEEMRFFDIESGLQVKVVDRGAGSAGAIPTEIYLGDYRAVGELRIAFSTTISIGRSRIRIALDAMQANAAIPLCLFEEPSGEQAEVVLPDPTKVMEDFMRVEIPSLTPQQTQGWLRRLTSARQAINDETTPNAKAVDRTLMEFQLACATHLRAIAAPSP